MESNNKLTKKDYLNTTLRAYLLQNAFNYSNYQGVGYANILYPALRKMYKDDEQLKKALIDNIEFYNTNPHFVPFVSNLQLVMLENGRPIEEGRSMKMALMGPLAGIGDSINQATMTPILLSICIGLSAEGSASGVLLFVLFNMAYFIIVSRILFFKGYNLGESVVDNLLGKKMTLIQNSLTVAGLTVTGAITANYVKFNITAQYVSEYKTVVIQEVLDGLFPKLIPVLLVFLGYWLISKKRFSALKVMLIYVLIATVGVLIRLL